MLSINTVPNQPKFTIPAGLDGMGELKFTLFVTEDDPLLKNKNIYAIVDLGDQTTRSIREFGPISGGDISPNTFPGVTGAVFEYRYFPGTYNVSVKANNYRTPESDVAEHFFTVEVTSSNTVKQETQGAVFGPVLPRDVGFPNAEQWNLNVGADIQIIESSVKMLLITTTGDRLMLPDYGTNLRRLLFEPNSDAIETLARDNIITALNKWEPRASLQGLTVQRDSNLREARIQAVFVTNLGQKQFTVDTTITR